MKLHQLVQGSQEWHQHRKLHLNASDAPAMLGCSQYKTRSQLLHELHTGIAPDVDPATQHRFDEGHRFEALARPLAEAIIDDDLFPVTGSDGELSASFDGLTMDRMVGFEHKTLSSELRAIMPMGDIQTPTAETMPLMYRVQMEQQCMVSGCERILFMASKWDGDELVEERHCWYAPDMELRARIVAGWQQFAADLATFTPTVPTVQAVAAPVESLPAVSVRLDGQLVVASNLPEFGVALRAFIERIPTKPDTDQQFADCESACKALKKAEDALEGAETHALAQMTDVEAMRRIVADLRNLARSTRLASEKMVAARKDQIRADIVLKGRSDYAEHVAALNDSFGCAYLAMVQPDFALAIKGKKSIDSLRSAVSDTLAAAKIEANTLSTRITKNLRTLNEKPDFSFLFADVSALVLKAPDDLAAVVQNRITEHQAKEAARIAADRERIANEERIKAEAALSVARAQVTELPSAKTATPDAAPVPTGPSAARNELNRELDRLSDKDLKRVLAFVQSRFPQEVAA